MQDIRQVGIYPKWVTYPPNAMTVKNNLLMLEHVNGDGTTSNLAITRGDAAKLKEWLNDPSNVSG